MMESCCFVLCTQLFALCFRAQWCVERFIFLDVISFLCFPAPFLFNPLLHSNFSRATSLLQESEYSNIHESD